VILSLHQTNSPFKRRHGKEIILRKDRHFNIPWGLIFAICLGILLRIFYLYEASQQPWFTNPLYDPQYNDYWAKGIVTGDWTLPPYVNDPEIRTTPHGRPPGYPYLLALIYFGFGTNPWSPRIIQCIFGVLNIILAWALTKRYYSQRFANLLAFFMATFWGFIYFESLLTYPVFAIFLLLLWTYIFSIWLEKPGKTIYVFILGLILGIFALFRPNGLLLLILLPIFIIKIPECRKSFSRIISIIFIFLLGISLPLIPCMVRNYIVAHDFVFISSYGGLNFYVGNHPQSNGAEPRIPELKEWIGCDEWSCFDYPAIVKGLGKSLGKPDITFSEANKYFYKSALTSILQNPGQWLSLMVKKVLLFWGPVEITNDTVPAWDKYYSKILRWLPGFPLYFSLFITGIILWIFSSFRHQQSPNSNYLIPMSLLIVVIYSFSVLPFFVASRYRIPIMPFIMISGIYTIEEFLTAIRLKNKLKFFAIPILVVLFLIIGEINFAHYQPSQSIWYFRNGVSASLAGKDTEAKNYYEKALEIDPENVFVRINYSQVLARLGRPSEGIYILTKNSTSNLNSPSETNALGYLFEFIGDDEKAQYYYAKAIVQNPSFTLAHANLANLFFKRHNFIEAKSQYQMLSQLQPDNPTIYFQLARIAEFEKKPDEAIHIYKKCLKLNSRLYLAWNNLGWLYEQTGNTNEAQKSYEKALSIKPDFMLTRINYSNLLLKLGMLARAEEQLKIALEYDSDNCQIQLLLGNIFTNQAQWNRAIETYKKVLELCPDYANAWNNLGLVLSLSGKEKEAQDMWYTALIFDDKLLESYINLIYSYEKQGLYEMAVSVLTQALINIPQQKELHAIWNGLTCYE